MKYTIEFYLISDYKCIYLTLKRLVFTRLSTVHRIGTKLTNRCKPLVSHPTFFRFPVFVEICRSHEIE